MKKIAVFGLSSILAIPFLSVALVFAHDETPRAATTKPTNQVAQTTDDTGDEDTATQPEEESVQERIQKRKAALKTRLSAAEKLKLQNKCQASQQGKISSLSGRIKGIETSRTQVYNNITTHLQKLSEKLQNRGVTTTELDAAITELETKIETFKTDLAAYKDAIEVLAAMDCKANPELFKETLEDARADLKTVQDDAAAVKAHVKDTIKPILKTIRAQLEAGDQEGEE